MNVNQKKLLASWCTTVAALYLPSIILPPADALNSPNATFDISQNRSLSRTDTDWTHYIGNVILPLLYRKRSWFSRVDIAVIKVYYLWHYWCTDDRWFVSTVSFSGHENRGPTEHEASCP